MRRTFGSLFAGIGGFDLGLERAGWECRWQVESSPFCRQVLERHWPDVPRYGDARTLEWEAIERVELLCAGFPCQPVSSAGNRRAEADDRWLWPEVERAVCGLRPDWLLVENVPGLLVRGLGAVLGDLAALGYDAEWVCIPAAAVGAEHVRERVWIVAYPNSRRREVGWLSELVWVEGESRRFPDRCRGQWQFADAPQGGAYWTAEPQVGRVADGFSGRVDRIRALGNAVVPQVAEWIGRRLT